MTAKKVSQNRFFLLDGLKNAWYNDITSFAGLLSAPVFTAATRTRGRITLACTECKQRNYNTTKNKKNNPDRLEMKKYCRFCKKHTVHRETK